MKKLSIHNQIMGAFGLILLIMLAIGGSAYWHLTTIERHTSAVKTDSVPGLYQSSQIKDAIAADYLVVVNLFVEYDPANGRNERTIAEQEAKFDRLIADYEKTIATDPDREAFERFKRAYAE